MMVTWSYPALLLLLLLRRRRRRLQADSETVAAIAASADGDIRNAVNALQMWCAGQVNPKP